MQRYSYGTCGGISSVGIDPANFMTRPFSSEMLLLAREIHEFLLKHRSQLNLNTVDLTSPFNHCTILLYYASKDTKPLLFLRPHSDCQYSHHTGKFLPSANSQVQNTVTVVYSLGSTRYLKWSRRSLVNGSRSKKWRNDNEWNTTFNITSDSLSFIHPDDENPMSPKNSDKLHQYLHGGVQLSKDAFSIGFAFRVVDSIKDYNTETNLMSLCQHIAEYKQSYKDIHKISDCFHRNILNFFINI